MKNRLKELIAEKETQLGRKLLQKEIARETGVDPATLSRYINDQTKSFRRDYVASLCQYFECGIGDMFPIVFEDSD